MSSLLVEKRDPIFALASNVANIQYEHLPPHVVEGMKMDILDTLGVSIAASGTAPACKKVAELVKEMGGKEESSIIGYGGKVPSHMAAFVNATLAHFLNYDDLHDALSIHIGSMVLPAAFAVAERVGKVSGKELITAYALSVDLECRVCRSLTLEKPRHDWNLYGWLRPQVLGYFGATAAAGRLLGLDEDRLGHAFGLVYSQVAGGKQSFIGGGTDKGIYSGYPALAGVLSALMAQKGIAGACDCLVGKAGLYNVYFQGEYDSSAITTDLGKRFETIGFYPMPCCSLIHPSTEVTLRMIEDHKIRPQDVEAVTVFVGPKTQRVCEPLQIRRNPRTMSEAQYSIPFTLGVAFTKGKPHIQHFVGDAIKDPEVLRLSNKVSYQPDPECEMKLGTGAFPAKVEIKLTNGRVLRSEQKGFRYGHFQRPMSKEELVDKFKECAAYSARPLPKASVEKVVGMVSHLEEVDDVSQIMQLVS